MSNAIRYANVQLDEASSSIGPFVVLGEPPRGAKAGEKELRFGKNATIRSNTVIYAGNKIGNNFQTGHGVLVREDNVIGDDVSIGSGSIVEHHVTIGNKVRIHSQAFVPEYSVLEDGVWIGPNVVVTNARYPNNQKTKDSLEGVTLKKGCMIGANSTILPGITIGERALVGAGSVVTRNVEAGTVVAGNPAEFIKSVSDISDYGS